MIFEIGYEYYSEHPLDCFVGKFKHEGGLIQDTADTYQGWLKLLGKKHALYECKIVDGRYNYKVDALGIGGTIYFPGKRTAKVEGGAVKRVRISDGKTEKSARGKNKNLKIQSKEYYFERFKAHGSPLRLCRIAGVHKKCLLFRYHIKRKRGLKKKNSSLSRVLRIF